MFRPQFPNHGKKAWRDLGRMRRWSPVIECGSLWFYIWSLGVASCVVGFLNMCVDFCVCYFCVSA
jgi:hypothetical protein